MTAPAAAPRASEPLAIVCGGGTIPGAVADAVARAGRPVILMALRGWADPAVVARHPHHWIALGQFGRFRRLLLKEGCRDLVFVGTVQRPPIKAIRLDWETIRVLPRVIRALRGGDDHLLSGIGRIMEDHGLHLLGAHEVAPEILVPEASFGTSAPSPRDEADIAIGLAVLDALGRFDVGQAIVVADRRVIAIEAAEGTDRMLARVAELRREGRVPTPNGAGVLVKAPKLTQDRRFDLPTIGPNTIRFAAAAGLAGIAVRAGETIMAEPEESMRAIERERVFVVGVGSRP